jgi:DNA/RNA-binding domain of Phe-tRNA-synthetase-like protein
VQFTIRPEVFERFPNMRVAVVVAQGIDNQADKPQIEAEWREAWAGAAEAAVYGNAQSHPRVQPWRGRFRAMGVSGKEFPSSIEAVLKRALKGGEPFRINPLVDFYNAVSLRHYVPAGGFDLDEISGPLELRVTRPGDHFTALDSEEPVDIPPGEVAYTDGPTVLTRHFVWRQARTGLITRHTRNVLLVSEVLGELGAEVAERVMYDLTEGVLRHFGVVPVPFLAHEQEPSLSW